MQTWFGGGVVDLRQATLDPMGATIEVNALFGGGNLVVPEEWNVETKVAGIGGIGDGRPQRDRSPEAPTLRVEGIALFGGLGDHLRACGRAGRRGPRPGLIAAS